MILSKVAPWASSACAAATSSVKSYQSRYCQSDSGSAIAFTCSYAASGKKAGRASRGFPVVTASHRSCMAFLKATDLVLGNALVCSRRPAPGATGSALGRGGNGGPAARAVGSSPVTDGVGETLGAALLVALTGRVLVPAPAFPPQAAQAASSAATATTTAGRRIRTPVSRHLTREGFYSGPPGRPVSISGCPARRRRRRRAPA